MHGCAYLLISFIVFIFGNGYVSLICELRQGAHEKSIFMVKTYLKKKINDELAILLKEIIFLV